MRKESIEELRDKILRLGEISGKLELFYLKRGEVKWAQKIISRFSRDEMIETIQNMELNKTEKEILEDFIKYVFSHKYAFKSRPEYVNLRLNLPGDKIAKILEEKNISFRKLVIDLLQRRFPADFRVINFSMRSYRSSFKFDQVLIPKKYFDFICRRIEREYGGRKSKKEVKKEIKKLIESEIKKLLEEIS
ncbi:hypothetical protein HRbin19_00944 [bacterium HR19]|nr:hypothetical protein HRbin19_00944 [bacterium HR19]